MEPPSPKEEQDLRFKAFPKLLVGTAEEYDKFDRYSLLACSNKYGLLFVAGPKTLKAVHCSDVPSDGNHRVEVSVSTLPTVSTDLPSSATHLLLSCDDLSLAVCTDTQVLFYDVRAFADRNATPLPFRTIQQGSQTIAAAWNPTNPAVIAVCLASGDVKAYDIQDTSSGIYAVPGDKIQARCLCWSPKGKQLVVGTKSGTLIQHKPDLKQVKVLPAPAGITQQPPELIDVLWISSYQFLGAYKDIDQNLPNLVIVNATKEGKLTCINYGDICYGGSDREQQFNFHHITEWNTIVCASGNSTEVSVLGVVPKTNSEWQQLILEDNGRADLPSTAQHQETYPVGFCVGFAATKPIPMGDDLTIAAMPILYMLSTAGTLSAFHIINSMQGAPHLTKAPEHLKAEGARQPEAPVPRRENLMPTFNAETSAFTSVSSKGFPVTFAPTSTKLTPQPPLKPLSFSTPAAASTPISITPLATFCQQKVSPPKAEPPASVLPQTVPPNVSVLSGSVPTFGSTPSSGLTAPTAVKPSVTIPPTEIVQENFDQAIQEEILHFNEELRELFGRSHKCQYQVGNQEQLVELRKGTESVKTFLKDVRDTTAAQNSEVHDLRGSMIQGFALAEEARSLNIRSKDARYMHLQRRRKLNPVSLKRMQEIRAKYQYMVTQLTNCRKCLDSEWKTYQAKRQGDIKVLEPPVLETLYQTLKVHRNIIHTQDKKLNRAKDICSYVKRMVLPRVSPESEELGKLAESLLKLPLSDKGTEKVKQPREPAVSPMKASQLRDFLSSRKVSTVKVPVPPEDMQILKPVFVLPKMDLTSRDLSSSMLEMESQEVGDAPVSGIELLNTKPQTDASKPLSFSFAPGSSATSFTQSSSIIATQSGLSFTTIQSDLAKQSKSQITTEPEKISTVSFAPQSSTTKFSGFCITDLSKNVPSSFGTKTATETSKTSGFPFTTQLPTEPNKVITVSLFPQASVESSKAQSFSFNPQVSNSSGKALSSSFTPQVSSNPSKLPTFSFTPQVSIDSSKPQSLLFSSNETPTFSFAPKPATDSSKGFSFAPKVSSGISETTSASSKVSSDSVPEVISSDASDAPSAGDANKSVGFSFSFQTSTKTTDSSVGASDSNKLSEASTDLQKKSFSFLPQVPAAEIAKAFTATSETSTSPKLTAFSFTLPKSDASTSQKQAFSFTSPDTNSAKQPSVSFASGASIFGGKPAMVSTSDGGTSSLFGGMSGSTPASQESVVSSSATTATVSSSSPESSQAPGEIKDTSASVSIKPPESPTTTPSEEVIATGKQSAPSSPLAVSLSPSPSSQASPLFGAKSTAGAASTAATFSFQTGAVASQESAVQPSGSFFGSQSSVFGGSQTTASSLFQTSGASIFGASSVFGGTTTSSAFGGTTTTSTSIFGGTTTTSVFGGATATSTSAFGGATTTSVFGGTTITTATPAFGGTTTTSAFGGNATTSVFGGTTVPSAFGGTTTTSAFGGTTVTSALGGTTTASVFGGTTATQATTTVTQVFGGTTTITPLFGGTTTAPLFGETKTAPAFGGTTTPPAFGGTTTPPAYGGTTTPPAFGGTTTPPAFGGTTTPPAFGVTTSAPAFGVTTSAPAFGATTTAPPFGSTTTAPPFGATTIASPFGATTTAPPFGATTTAPPFGATTTAPAFGGTTTAPAFGGTTTAPAFGGTTTAPAFGGTTTVFGGATTTSAFGTPTSGVSLFGAQSSTTTTTAASIFGKPASGSVFGGGGSVFGGSASPTVTSSAFGSLPSQTTSPFGSQPNKLFGNEPAQAFGGSAFGGSSVFGQSPSQKETQPVFGQPSAFGSQPGGGFFSGLGGKPSDGNANKNVFGGGTVFGGGSSSGIFGGGSTVESSGFAVTSTATGFGSMSPNKPTFGGSPLFGGSPSFGGNPQPTFGGNPTFGNTFGTSSGSFSGFASASGDTGPSFGSLAQQQQPSPSFGASPSFGTTNPQQQPQFGSSTFSQWR